MALNGKPLALTAELVARVARIEPDPGPQPGTVYLTDEDYDAMAAELLAGQGGGPLWVFAYGSLIWKPEFSFIEHRRARLRGWHRSFCLRLVRWRGTPQQPGLMMALDRGGQCNGVAYRLPDDDHLGQLGRLLRRETSTKPPGNQPRWIDALTTEGPARALAFTAGTKGRAYCGRLSPEEVARTLALAAGHWGSGAEYLYNTVTHLEQFGIRDRNLWRLQELVAAEIARLAAGNLD